MKKIVLMILAAVVFFALTYCSSDDSSSEKMISKKNSIRNENENFSKTQAIPVGEANFFKLVTYIEKYGSLLKDVGNPHQLTFIDSRGNKHYMMITRRDNENYPDANGQAKTIGVWAYKESIEDAEHCFSYFITSEKVYTRGLEKDGTWKNYESVRLGYEEFLEKVLK